jgi:hypothetical protein
MRARKTKRKMKKRTTKRKTKKKTKRKREMPGAVGAGARRNGVGQNRHTPLPRRLPRTPPLLRKAAHGAERRAPHGSKRQ